MRDRKQLINSLVAQADPVTPLAPWGKRLLGFLAVGMAWVALCVSFIGIRGDLAEQIGSVSFWIETAAPLGLAIWMAADSLRLAVPGQYSRIRYVWLPATVLALWVASVIVRFVQESAATGQVQWVPDAHFACAICISVFACLPSGLLLTMLKKGYVLNRAAAGMLAGLSSAGLGALGSQIICVHNQPIHIMTWHIVPVILVGLINCGIFIFLSRGHNSGIESNRPRGR